LVILLAVPLLVVAALGAFVRRELVHIETSTRYLVDQQVRKLAVVGNASRAYTEMRVHMRSMLLAATPQGAGGGAGRV
jgi:hypothetical protein